MAYSVQADLESVFGTKNILKWSNLSGGTAAADTTRIAAGIAYADAWIDD